MLSRLAHVLVFLLAPGYCIANPDDDLKHDAVERVVSSHDCAMFVATGALYLKQEALRNAVNGRLAPETEARVDGIIERSVRNTAWFKSAWRQVIEKTLSAEEADSIATHFGTDIGRIQRQIMELAVHEMLMTSYSFTNRIEYGLAGSEHELRDLQVTVSDRASAQHVQLSSDPRAVSFVGTGGGAKYMKALMTQGVGVMTAHFEAVARDVRMAARFPSAQQ